MTVVDVALAVLATLATSALLTKVAVYWLGLPCKCDREHDEHEQGGP